MPSELNSISKLRKQKHIRHQAFYAKLVWISFDSSSINKRKIKLLHIDYDKTYFGLLFLSFLFLYNFLFYFFSQFIVLDFFLIILVLETRYRSFQKK
jgi:hypothetical protein